MIDPSQDGITHINVYSKGKTELGRLLSNFAHTPFTYRYVEFASVEAYWYYSGLRPLTRQNPLLITYLLNDLDKLSTLYGSEAKSFGRALNQQYGYTGKGPDKEKLKEIYKLKLAAHPRIQKLLWENKLPLLHYYVMGNVPVDASEFQWTVDLWNEIKNDGNNDSRET